jgi:hypothetical protein
VRSHFGAPPWGWPQDAVDGALLALLAAEQLSARHEGKDVDAKSLTRPNLSKADFRVPDVDEIPSADERINVIALVRTVLGLTSVPPETLSEQTGRMLDALVTLAEEVSGDPPLPARDDLTLIDELRGLTGNRRVKRTAMHKPQLDKLFRDWSERKQKVAGRLTRWRQIERMLAHAGTLDAAASVREQVQAIRDNRALLEEPDPVRSLYDRLSTLLRERVSALHAEFEETRFRGHHELFRLPEWDRVSEDLQDRLLRQHQMLPHHQPDVSTDDKLLAALDQLPLSTLVAARDAIPQRVARIREEVVRSLRPEAVSVTLPRRTLHSPEEVDAWLRDVEELLKREMSQDGTTRPVIV